MANLTQKNTNYQVKNCTKVMEANGRPQNDTVCLFQQIFSLGNHKLWATLLFYTIASLSMALNLLLVYGFHKTSRPFTKVTLLFVYLSSLDWTSVILSLLEFIFGGIDVQIPCWSYGIIFSANCTIFELQLLTLCSLSYLRFQSIRTPLTTVQINPSKKPLILLLVLDFLVTSCIGATFFTLGQLEISYDTLKMVLLAFDCVNLLALGFVVVVNIFSYVTLQRKRRATNQHPSIHQTDSASRGVAVSNRSLSNEREALKTLAIITVFYCVCCLPLLVGYILYPFVEIGAMELLAEIDFNLYYANTGINSLIYILRNKKLRKFFTCKATWF